jgi:hypothetical protein
MEVLMDALGFRKFLEDRNLSDEEISASIELAERFENYISASGHSQGTVVDVNNFSRLLIENDGNTWGNYYALARYGSFTGNNEVYVGVLDLIDGAEAMGNLSKKAEVTLGAERRDAIFEGVELPPLGFPNHKKVSVTQMVIPRLLKIANTQEYDKILSDSLRDLNESWYKDEKDLFDECPTLDDFLDKNAQNFVALLEKIRDEGGLFFTQEITDEVLEYARNEPLIVRGVRDGDILYEVKIPHMTKEYLAATDDDSKRYYYCHCPWVKEALMNGDPGISPVFCKCSAGFHKKRWEVLLDQPLKAEIIESVLKGDDWCKIAIHLPDGLP